MEKSNITEGHDIEAGLLAFALVDWFGYAGDG